jgi:8-oxo-dGTP pyrophosphatase MutT (NUDIX family)
VLLLLYPQDDQLFFVLTRRTDTLNNHQGQISLPGGSQEPGETLPDTAVRETNEELGIHLDGAELLGRLASLYIPPSDFEIHPFVAHLPTRPDFAPSPAEVAELIKVPLDSLLDTHIFRVETWTIRGVKVEVPFYLIEGHKIWGATAMVLSEMEQRLRTEMGEPLARYP